MADDEEISDEDLPSIHMVTIMWDEEGPAQVDLGTLSPWVAISLLNMVTDSLEMILHPPTIRYDNQVIFEAILDTDD
jgi:hypothetical protein